MNKTDLVKIIAETKDFNKKDVAEVVDAALKLIKAAIADSRPVTLAGFGCFRTHIRKSYTGRNPKTQEKVTVPERKVVKFKLYADKN